MTEQQMLKGLIEISEAYREAVKKYAQHPGGGASQKIKNRLWEQATRFGQQVDNYIFNIKQFLK